MPNETGNEMEDSTTMIARMSLSDVSMQDKCIVFCNTFLRADGIR